MLKGLNGMSPPVNLVPADSKNVETDLKESKGFSDVLNQKDIKKPVDMKPPNALASKMKEADSREEQVETTDEPVGPVKKTGDFKVRSQKERAIRKFMDSFESEFGIPPQKMVDAMAQLTSVELEQAPEKTVNQVVSQLNLNPEEHVQAKQMYVGLLDQLQQIEMRAELPVSTDHLLSQLSSDRMQVNHLKKDLTSQKIGDLNQKFWMGDVAKASSSPVMPVENGLLTKQQIEKLPMQDIELALNTLMHKIDPKSIYQQQPLEVPDGQEQLELKTVEDLLKVIEQKVEMGEVDPESVEVQEIRVLAPLLQLKAALPAKEFDPKLSEKISNELLSILSPEFDKNSMSPEGLSIFQKVMGLDRSTSEQEQKSATGQESLTSATLASQDTSLTKTFELPPMNPLNPAPVQMGPVDKAENNQLLLNQAQVLIQKGGGEMKLEMSPEGMGSVQMRLKVMDGKVELLLSAENKEVKKVLENSIQDLKTSLAAHKLVVDQVRVDVVNQTMGSSDVRQDLQNQMNDFMNQQQRDGTKQFWQQFNENFGNRQARESYFDAQNIRTGMREQKLPGFGDDRTSTARVQGNRGRSLNLVA